MSDALKRIEERHRRYQRHGSSPAVQVHEDVVKLARALNHALEFLDDLEASAVFDEWSIDNEPRAAGAYMLHAEVKRTLEEVAGD
jgi:hypothetical protein